MKRVGYTRFHLAISFLKAQMRILLKATTSTSLNVILGQITKAKRKMARGGKKKEKAGGQGGAVSKQNLLSEISLHFKMFENETLAVEDVLNQLLRALSFKKKNRTKQFES